MLAIKAEYNRKTRCHEVKIHENIEPGTVSMYINSKYYVLQDAEYGATHVARVGKGKADRAVLRHLRAMVEEMVFVKAFNEFVERDFSSRFNADGSAKMAV